MADINDLDEVNLSFAAYVWWYQKCGEKHHFLPEKEDFPPFSQMAAAADC